MLLFTQPLISGVIREQVEPSVEPAAKRQMTAIDRCDLNLPDPCPLPKTFMKKTTEALEQGELMGN